jgi:RimJ/RimL family protein N-acetyltransferase
MARATAHPELIYRKLLVTDHAIFEAHLLALDPDSRRLRFGMSSSDSFLREYAERCIAINAVIHGAFQDGRLIGVAELRPIGDWPTGEAEVAFSVLSDWRNQGIGTILFARLLRSARNRAFHRLYMTCLRHNVPMQALAQKFSAEIVVEIDESVALLEAPRRTMISLMREVLDEAQAYTAIAFEWQRRHLRRNSESKRP